MSAAVTGQTGAVAWMKGAPQLNSSKTRVSLLGISALSVMAAASPAAYAQDNPAAPVAATADTQADSSEIVVTARRRSESIVNVPLAITVLTASKLQQLDITDTTQLANYTPGLTFSDYTPGYGRNDRGAVRPLIFRGLALGLGGGVTSAGGMFLDGAAVVGNEVPAGMDIGQVEVLRGPQSVYFGRATMTGAVSYRTKKIPDHLTGEVDAKIASRDTKSLEASIAGPLIPGLLGARITGLTESNDGYVTNGYNNGATKLGARSRDSVSGTLDFTPASKLEFKGYVNYFRDNDGASATAFIPTSLDNCKLPGATYTTFCGEIPNQSHSVNYINLAIPTFMADQIFNSPLNAGWFKRKVGLQREVLNMHLVSDWQINDYLKLESITGYHTNATIQAADGVGQPPSASFPYASYFYSVTNRSRDFSQELRLTSAPEKRISWTLGVNYINAQAQNQAIVDFQFQDGSTALYDQGINTDSAKTYGVFGGVYFKATGKLTLSAEGRYQSDHRSTSQGGAALSTTFDSFNPRVSADYDVGGGRRLYASYASGTRPGGFNANLASYLALNNATLTGQLRSAFGSISTSYAEERLKIGEIGFKGSFAGGKGFFDFNGYYGKLGNQQINFSALVPYLGFSVVATSNVGKTTIYGLEYQGNYNFTHELSLATTFAWNHTYRDVYLNQSAAIQYGTSDLSGTAMPNSPQFSGSAVLGYDRKLSGPWSAFANIAYVYRGKQWVDSGNFAYIKGRSQVDIRAGVSNAVVTIEAFMTNVFNDRNYTNGEVSPDYGSNQYYAFFGAAAEPRTIGGRFRAKF